MLHFTDIRNNRNYALLQYCDKNKSTVIGVDLTHGHCTCVPVKYKVDVE
jgi:hypothetical protein